MIYQLINWFGSFIIKPYENMSENIVLIMNETLFFTLIGALFFNNKDTHWNRLSINLFKYLILATSTLVSVILLSKHSNENI